MSELLAMADEETLKLWNGLRLGYTETRGLPLLRTEIAKDYPELNGDHVLCFAGAEEGIYCTFKTLLAKTDHAIVVTPCYQSLKSIPETLCQVSTLDLTPESAWTLDINELRSLVRPGVTKLIACNFPHNPTGTSLTREMQRELVALAKEFDLWLFCDEVYRGVEREVDGEGKSVSLPPVATVYNKGISLGAVSKTYGLAGLRIGWICCSDVPAVHAIADNKHYLSICNSGPSEVLALIALRARDQVVGRIMRIIRANEAYLAAFMAKHPTWLSWTPPKGGCCGFARLNLPAEVDLAEVTERLVQQHGVLILPGENFPVTSEANRDSIRKHFRVGLGRAAFPQALDAFETALPQVLQSMGVSLP
jgi:aspartate/methionine/tyrosine aminotransferase